MKKIYNLKKFWRKFSLFFKSFISKHIPSTLWFTPRSGKLIVAFDVMMHDFFQKCPANYARPIMTRSWPNSRFDMTPHSPPILDTCQFRYVHCDENPCKINSIWLQIFSKHLRKFIFHEVQWNLIWNIFLAVRSC